MSNKVEKNIIQSFVEHELQMDLFKAENLKINKVKRNFKTEQKNRNLYLFFVAHLLQMHQFKNQIDFNKLRAREIENKQKKPTAISDHQKKEYGAKKWENFTSFFCRTRVTNALIQKTK